MLTVAITVSARWNAEACNTPEPDHGTVTSRVAWILFGLSTICVSLRVISRMFFLEGSLGMDDWTIILVWIIAVPSTTVIQLCEYRPSERPESAG